MDTNPNLLHFDDPAFWDEGALREETDRVFNICNDCRMCFSYCESFPTLFDAAEENDYDVKQISKEKVDEIVDYCFECKLCYVNCPYKPPHDYMLDFPRLMLRAKAVKAKRDGIPLKEKLISNTDRLGKLGSATAPLSNWGNRLKIVRKMVDSVAGIHPMRELPEYHRETFPKWYKKQQPAKAADPTDKVVLFSTCLVNYNEPGIGKAAVKILQHNNIEIEYPEQVCCGMPFLDVGDADNAIKNAKKNIDAIFPWIEKGYKLVIPEPTCSYMFRNEYPDILKGDERAAQVADNTFDFSEYLMQLHKEEKLKTEFSKKFDSIAYHIPCHMKAQSIGYKSRDLLNLITENRVQMIEKCSCVDGTWGMRTEYHDLSLKYGKKLFRGLENSGAENYCSDCSLAAMQVKQGTGEKPTHPIEMLAAAYGLTEKEY